MSGQSREQLNNQDGSSHQILRITTDSEQSIDELFRPLTGPRDAHIPLSVPMRQRNLPPSFFKPPETGTRSASHSRESSLDASFSPPPHHTSSPLSPGSPAPTAAATEHQRTHHNGLTIAHNRAHSSPASLQQTLALAPPEAPNQHIRQSSEYDKGLPPGWQSAFDKTSGRRYYINHNDKTTTWTDPRITLRHQQIQQEQQALLQKQLAQQKIVLNTTPPHVQTINNLNITQNLGPLPNGWQEKFTDQGEPYYVNHVDRSTTWFDPRIPQQLQHQVNQTTGGLTPRPQPPSFAPLPLIDERLINANAATQSAEAIQHRERVQELLKETEKLRQKKEELRQQQTRMYGQNYGDETITPGRVVTTGVDPFLGGGSLLNDCHSRQQSADSGLGLGPNYSLPQTPEGILNDSDDRGGINQSSADDLDMDSLAIENSIMDSDDLMSSLPDELSTDIQLSDIEAFLTSSSTTNKDHISWL